MNGVVGNLINALAEIWRSIGIPQKVSIVLIGIATLGATALIIFFGSQPDWQILYSNMDSKTAAKIYDVVKDSNVQVKLTDSGRTIMVPSTDVYKLRMKVVNEGIPVDNSGDGWGLFDEMKLGLTDRQQQIAFQRAVQGELQKMIKEMPGIIGCSVMLTIPKKKVFTKSQTNPSASIMVVVEQGRALSRQQVNSIRYLVSSAVSGMEPNNVTITDSRGQLLAKEMTAEEELNGDSSRQRDICERTERDLKQKAEAILTPIVGLGNVVAMVSCDMDFDNVDKVIESYSADGTVVLSEKVVTENSSKEDASNSSGGKGGAASNVTQLVDTDNPSASANEKTSKEERKTSERKYAVPKTVQKVTTKGARIKKLAVAVTISKKAEGESWTADELKNFKQLVIAAVGAKNYDGVDAEKSIEVKEMAFAPVKEPEVQKASFMDTAMFQVQRVTESPLVRPVVGIILLLVLYRVFKGYFNKTSVEGSPMMGNMDEVYGEEIKKIETEDEIKTTELGNMIDTLRERTTAAPEDVAGLMENWLAQDQN